tara:strand:- start:1711 stop:3081 length:1371 start_codon:yes stop_codon:yes gene_type:complete
MIKKESAIVYLLIGSTFFIFMDAYTVFGIPVSWLGQVLLTCTALLEFRNYKHFFTSRLFVTCTLLLIMPQLYVFLNDTFLESDLIYVFLRYFNVVSFVIVLGFITHFCDNTESNKGAIIKKLELFCIVYSLIVIYIFIAQIYDFYEPIRGRPNTSLLGESAQSIFWLSQPHRAMGTFREPSFLITFFYPIVLLVAKSFTKTNILFCILTGLALGLTRSDYARFFSIIVFIIFIYSFYKDRKANLNLATLLLSIFIFSTFGVLECNLNPGSNECSDYIIDVEKINGSGKLKIKSNNAASVVDIGNERLNVLSYFYNSFRDLKPNGLSNVNQNFQSFESVEISNEMYFTNRTIPSYLLTRYSAQNFGTGNYSILKYEINVQNIVVYYTQGFGVMFIVLIFLLFVDFITKHQLTVKTVYFLILLLFFAISPIEEFNAYYGLVVGLAYSLLIKGQSHEKI